MRERREGKEERERKKEKGSNTNKKVKEGGTKKGREPFFLLPMKSLSLRQSCLGWPLR